MKIIRRIVLALLCLSLSVNLLARGVQAEEQMPDRKVIFIGDSRTVEMYGNVNQVNITYDLFQMDERGDFWSAMIGAKYDWMVNTGIPVAESQLTDNSAVVILMGVNDCTTEESAAMAMRYADYINQKADEWSARGTETYVVSVNPVDGDYYFGTIMINNTSIEKFNAVMTAQLSDKITYIDTFSQIIDSFVSPDQLHYEHDTYLDIYRKVMSAVAEDLAEKDSSGRRLKHAGEAASMAERVLSCRNSRKSDARICDGIFYGLLPGAVLPQMT